MRRFHVATIAAAVVAVVAVVAVGASCAHSSSSAPRPVPACSPPATSPAPPAPPAVAGTPGLAEAMAKLSFMRGVWVGPASGVDHQGVPYQVTQTERMGPMLGGDIVVIEGRAYKDDGSTGFNAFAVVSWDPHTERYEMRSYAQGRAGTFELKLTDGGYVWEVPAGPGAVVRFTATLGDGRWREVGEYIAPGQPPVQTFEMNLTRVGDTDWPLGTPVAPDVATP